MLLVRKDTPWMKWLREGLGELSRGPAGRDQRENPDAFLVAMHMDALEERAAGRLDWAAELARKPLGSTAASYVDMVETGGRLPRYPWGPIAVSVDLFDPERKATAWGDELEAVEVMASAVQLYPWARGTQRDGSVIKPNDLQSFAKMAAYGEAYGAAVAVLVDALNPEAAFGDVGALVRAAARGDKPPWERVWPVAFWSRDRVSANIEKNATDKALTPQVVGKADPFERAGLKAIAKDVGGGRFFQFRTIFGTRGRSAAVDRAMAERLGLGA